MSFYMCNMRGVGGNGLLEFILLLPVLLLLFLGIVDTGLALKERAYLTDAIRAGAHDCAGSMRENKPLIWSDSYEQLEVDFNKVKEIVDATALFIDERVRETKQDDKSFAVEVSAILLDVDKNTGKLFNSTVLYSQKRQNAFSLQSQAPKYPYVSRSTFLNRTINAHEQPNQFSVISAPVYNVLRGEIQTRYYDKSIVIYSSVEAVTDAYARDYIRKVIGEVFAFQHQELTSVRGGQL